MLLTKARANPRWLFLLPLLCLLWVNTHGSILLGLFVLAVELGWSLIPERFVQRIGGVQPVALHRARSAWRCWGA